MKKRVRKSEDKELQERYLHEARRFVEALGKEESSPQELQDIRQNSKNIIKSMLRERNDRHSAGR